MGKNSGIIFKHEDGRYCKALNAKQQWEGKRAVMFYADALCTKPILIDGKQINYLVSLDKLQMIGFID